MVEVGVAFELGEKLLLGCDRLVRGVIGSLAEPNHLHFSHGLVTVAVVYRVAVELEMVALQALVTGVQLPRLEHVVVLQVVVLRNREAT